jgi:uncharacterized protein
VKGLKMKNTQVLFVSDLHGKKSRYEKLFEAIRGRCPGLVLLGGDLLPHPRMSEYCDFMQEYLAVQLRQLRDAMGEDYPLVGLIFGNDDARSFEPSALEGEAQGIWTYLHMQVASWGAYQLAGYAYVPPTPFLLKDWERYDVSRFVDPGCVPPTEGRRSVPVNPDEAEYATIEKDLVQLTGTMDMAQSILLFHTPPYQTHLDRAGLDGMKYDHVPLDVNVGSIALKRFIEEQQPHITLHGHIHESSRITGHWRQQIGNTHCFSAAWDSEELALVSFVADQPEKAVRELL